MTCRQKMESNGFFWVSLLALLALLCGVHSQTTSYAPCSYTLDITNTYYTITCTSPLTAEQVLGAFSQTPINSNIRQLRISNIIGSNDDYINQIVNRIASSQYTLTILALDQVNVTAVPNGVKLFPNLILLSLANNKLVSLSRGALNVSSNLEFLGLQNNNLTAIEPGTFDEANWSMTAIGLQSNQVYQLSSGVFQSALQAMIDKGGNGHFDLGGNTLSCDCSLAWLIRDNRHLLPAIRQGKCSGGLSLEDIPADVFANC